MVKNHAEPREEGLRRAQGHRRRDRPAQARDAWTSTATRSPRSRRSTWPPGTRAPEPGATGERRAGSGRAAEAAGERSGPGGSRLRVRTVEILPGEVVLIDQLALPQRGALRAPAAPGRRSRTRISDMTVRGAPAIGVTRPAGMALAAAEARRARAPATRPRSGPRSSRPPSGLLATRPTAVNLPWALDEMRARLEAALDRRRPSRPAAVPRAAGAAQAIHDDDVDRCLRIGEHGAALFKAGDRILTHCNAGALATAGYGTALGVIRRPRPRTRTSPCWSTRRGRGCRAPGSPPGSCRSRASRTELITDNMAGYFMRRGEVDGVVVGADRIAANGDTANKIGTYTRRRAGQGARRAVLRGRAALHRRPHARRRRRHPHRGARRGRGHVRSAAQQVAPDGRRARATRPSTSRRPPTSPPSSPRPACCGRRSAPALADGLRRRGVPRRERASRPCAPTSWPPASARACYPLTGLTSKPMVPILNRPVMEHMLRLLRRHGVTEVAANLHYHPDKIRSLLRRRRRVRRRAALQLRGASCSARPAAPSAFREFLGGGTFLVMSGDGLTDIDLTAFLAAHRRVRRHRHHGRQGGRRPVALRRGRARRRRARRRLPGEAAARGGALRPLQLRHLRVRAGDLRLHRRRRVRRLGQGRLPGAAGRRTCRSTAGELEGYWNDVGNIEQYRAEQLRRPARAASRSTCRAARSRPRVWVGQGTRDRARRAPRAAGALGAGCLVESGAELIGPLIIGDGCVVERGAVLEGVIHWDGVKAGRGSRLAGSILGRNVVVHHEAVVHEDAVIGDRSEVAPHALVDAGRALRAALAASGPTAPAATRGTLSAVPRVHAGRRTRRPARPRLPAALRRVRAPGALALRARAPATPAAARRPLPALRRAARRAGRPAAARPAPRRRMPACRECAGRDLAFASAAAAFSYEGPARALVTACKFRALRSLADDMAARAAPAFAARRRAPAPTPSSPGCPATATTSSSAASTRPSCWRAGLRATPGSPMLRCSAACATAPARAGSTGPRARPTSTMRSRCGRAASGY